MQGVNTGESGAPNGEQGMRTQEIHIVSSNAHRQAYASMQNQRLQKQFEPMTFSNTPFPAEKEGHRRGKAESTPRWRFAFVASLIAIDLAVMLLSLTVSLVINGAAFDAIGDVMPFWLFLILFSLIWLLCLAFAGTYHRHVMADGYELYAKIINASLLTIISYCSLAFIFKLALPRTALIIAPVIAFFLDIIARWQMRQALHRHRSKGSCKYRTVVIGSSDGINKALQTMRNCMNWGYEPVAVCPIEADPASKDAYVVTSYTPDANIEGSSKLKVIPFNSAFPRICESLGVQEVYVADVLSRDSEMLHGLSLAVESLGMELALAVSLADVSGHRLYLRNTTEQPVLLASLPQYTGAANVIKRLLDIIGSLCALIISSPILLGVAIAIKLDDGGPVFFSQTRIGLHGKPFKMYKFRSMEIQKESEEKKAWTVKNDPRVTGIGKFMRHTSLDELPQLFNILKGEMSLVGPRPERPFFVEKFREEIPRYMVKHQVRPGLTGWAQVNGYRGDTSIRKRIECDLYYIENWSVGFDIKIMFLTIFKGFINKNAY